MKPNFLALFGLVGLFSCGGGAVGAQDLPYVNFENHPVNGVAISPDGTTLAVAHTADARVQLFDVSEGPAVPIGHMAVGIDPVSVRFRSDRELWVANHISDSISVLDVEARTTIHTLATLDEPADIAFAGGKAFVSCSQANTVLVYDLEDLTASPTQVAIDAEDPRAMAVSNDGSRVYVAIFESGNATTILGGGILEPETLSFPPNVTRLGSTPYGGQNPPPNAGNSFEPAISTNLPSPPQVGMIVRKNRQGRWMDDNGGDWTAVVSGAQAVRSGRPSGWDLPDRDVAIIDTGLLTVSYTTGLMNIGMALGHNPATDAVSLVGTDATNEIRFEPNLNGRFLRVLNATVDANGNKRVSDLNPHLDYSQTSSDQASLSVGDPRNVVWSQDGSQAFVTGMGSNNVVMIGPNGGRLGAPIGVGEGPNGAALSADDRFLYVWNHFEASLSTVSVAQRAEIDRLQVFNPLPAAITEGRALLYDTHETSGNGLVSCASCHVDGRMDRLAWDLGDPSGELKAFNQNCTTDLDPDDPCTDFHPMKGPMMTQTMQDIIGHEPFHWRADRDGLEEFNGAFTGLLGRQEQLTDSEMQRFEDFLATIAFPPNPFRNLDNSLPEKLPLRGHFSTGRFGRAGQPLPDGNAQRGVELYVDNAVDDGTFHCANCHTLPTGMAVNGELFAAGIGIAVGGSVMPTGPNGENHLGVVSVDGSTNRSIKVPQLRNLYEKVGFDMTQRENRAGFGFLHDGSIDSLARFVSEPAFTVTSDQQVADLVALMLAFSGSDFPMPNPQLGNAAPQSKDSHAAVGHQVVLNGSPNAELLLLRDQAAAGRIDLIARAPDGRSYRRTTNGFSDDLGNPAVTLSALPSGTVFTATPAGLGQRLAHDRDGDGVFDGVEIRQGSNPADASDDSLRPTTGLWYNPARSGHGFDLELLGEFMFVTWYTYEDDGTPVWYQAAAPFANQWLAELNRFERQDGGEVAGTVVGTMRLDFTDASNATFDWTLGVRSGSESFTILPLAGGRTLRNYTGTWFDADEAGWGMTFHSEGNVRVGVLYYYDDANQPRWALGQGSNATSESITMLSFQGFCPDCERVDPTFVEAGSVQVDFMDLRRASINTDVAYPDGGVWQREVAAFGPLSDPAFDPTVF